MSDNKLIIVSAQPTNLIKDMVQQLDFLTEYSCEDGERAEGVEWCDFDLEFQYFKAELNPISRVNDWWIEPFESKGFYDNRIPLDFI